MPLVIVNPSPKTQFQQTKAYIETHRALIERDDLSRGLNFALLEYQRQLCEQKIDYNAAAANHFRMLGALEFINTFRTLAEMPKPIVVPTADNLDHKA